MEAADAGGGGGGGSGGGSGEKTNTPREGGEKTTKRKMKTAYQLELLEKTYAMASYPSEALRAELSAKIGLSDRQLQMWFCHRRLKDRKASDMATGAAVTGAVSGSGSSSHHEPRKALARMSAPAVPRTSAEVPVLRNRYYEYEPIPVPQPSMSETRAIAFVESQLGEPIREDGPVLGVEFDPLPPGAFGAPIEIQTQFNQPARPYERQDAKSIKTSSFFSSAPSAEHCFIPSSASGKRKAAVGGSNVVQSQAVTRALQEYKFLPEQPSVRSNSYERLTPSHFYDPSVESTRVSPLQTGGSYHGDEQVRHGYPLHDQTSNATRLGNEHTFPGSTEFENFPQKNLYPTSGNDGPFSAQHITGIENPFLTPDRRILREEDASRLEKKRKSEESRIAKEVEAHEKRIRKELEKQDILRRKREEQMRKEMERLDRERRKEEDRLLREKQREEERYQRELRREHERREKFLLKENLRAEKMRRKEEMRREKEAARIKAANERATARRLAKESMELIEDERLELMELAASSKGLPSIISLDSDTLQNLTLFRDMLSKFPPKSVQLKHPFAVQPWVDSDENIGNLLMVWRFLITFADVLTLWPFTLDEFVQALHDYESRLLAEVHIVLLRSIIKDIEDVARTPAGSSGVSHNSAANPGGGHPHIVEGAYAWGFDIRNWQRHLNPLTWPEILRQFALSAGFGPQLKKRSIERAYYRDENEGHDGKAIISTLRSGAAAENALAVMQQKGFSRLRRSRHRLTPGTVKFAAFHVLSLEGSKGLAILEVADRIQKSGLRDLTTSKTPEASIAAALSRDTKLFERTAPSTYCVRSAYRKDPADAEAILAAAREKIQIFENGLSESEEAEKDAEEANNAEGDEDSESDGVDDPDNDDVNFEENLSKGSETKSDAKVTKPSPTFGDGKDILLDEVGKNSRGNGNLDKVFSPFPREDLKGESCSGALNDHFLGSTPNCHESSYTDREDTEIDESNSGNPWVQGLMEGEYSALTVEERLNALVALIGVAIEGNSIRVVLEERLEAANSLKKQMWAEAQLDKRRLKEEYIGRLDSSSFLGMKAEPSQVNTIIEGVQSPSPVGNRGFHVNLNSAANNEIFDMEDSNNFNIISAERSLIGQEFSTNPESAQPPQYGYVAEKSRSHMKSYINHKAEGVYVYRSLPLGQDRRRNRYWQFVTSASRNDPGCGRIFFESRDGFWRLIDSEEAFDALLAALDTRGTRESHLHSMLQKIEPSFKEAVRMFKCNADAVNLNQVIKSEITGIASSPDYPMDIDSPSSMICGLASEMPEQSTSFRIEFGHDGLEKTAVLKRYQDFQRWLWKECFDSMILCAKKYGKKRCSELLGTCYDCYESYFSEEKHCRSCHKTFRGGHHADAIFSEHVFHCEDKQKMDSQWTKQDLDFSLPVRVQMLKTQLSHIEASIPSDALQSFWTEGYRKSWGVKLHSSSSAENLLEISTLLEGAIKRDHLSPKFETTNELLSLCASKYDIDDSASHSGSVPVLPWIPQTTAAVALRLMDLDCSISYLLHQKVEFHKDKGAGEFNKLPSRHGFMNGMAEFEPIETPEESDFRQEYNWLETGMGHNQVRGRGTRGRGRGRGRGGRGQRGNASVSRFVLKEEKARKADQTARKQTRGRARGRGRSRGRRSVRPRQRSQSRVSVGKDMHLAGFVDAHKTKENSPDESIGSSEGEEWDAVEVGQQTFADEGDDNSLGFSGSDDNSQEYGDEHDDGLTGYGRDYGSKPEALMDDDSEEDEADVLGDGDPDPEGDADYENEEIEDDVEEDEDLGDEDGDEAADGQGNGDEDEGMESYSSDYSD